MESNMEKFNITLEKFFLVILAIALIIAILDLTHVKYNFYTGKAGDKIEYKIEFNNNK